MSYQENFIEIPLTEWVETAARHAREGYRFVHMTGTAIEDALAKGLLSGAIHDGQSVYFDRVGDGVAVVDAP